MVRDLIIDMKERDLLTEDKSNASVPMFDSLWGNIFDEDKELDILICNIIIPEAYWSIVGYEDGEMTCRFKSSYIPNTSNFRIRLVGLRDGKYYVFERIRGDFGLPVNSYVLSKNIAAPIPACMLPFIDIDGEFMIKMVQNSKSEVLDKAYIYSAKSTDICINYSDDQASQLLTLCAPGKSYRYPTTGVGITKYLNCVVAHSDLQKVLEAQFNGDKKPIQDAEFDNGTCKLDVLFSPEKEESDMGLDDIDDLNLSFFSLFTDEYVRRNVVLNELSDTDFMELLNGYPYVLNILLFTDYTTSVSRIANKVEPGQFNGVGEVVPSDQYYIISATLEANTIVMFNDETEDNVKGAPIFIINDNDETRLYTALVEQPYWLTETCHKCFILKRRAVVKYMIRQDQFRAGKGLYMVPQTSANIKNMLGLVQDIHTGRLLGIVSNSTNISDMTLDEITQHIYATQINQ